VQYLLEVRGAIDGAINKSMRIGVNTFLEGSEGV